MSDKMSGQTKPRTNRTNRTNRTKHPVSAAGRPRQARTELPYFRTGDRVTSGRWDMKLANDIYSPDKKPVSPDKHPDKPDKNPDKIGGIAARKMSGLAWQPKPRNMFAQTGQKPRQNPGQTGQNRKVIPFRSSYGGQLGGEYISTIYTPKLSLVAPSGKQSDWDDRPDRPNRTPEAAS